MGIEIFCIIWQYDNKFRNLGGAPMKLARPAILPEKMVVRAIAKWSYSSIFRSKKV
jgi:hypothetical protein